MGAPVSSSRFDDRFLAGSPHCRQWLSALFQDATENIERDLRRTHDGLREDGSQYVVGYLLAHTGLPPDEQTALVARILGQKCRI